MNRIVTTCIAFNLFVLFCGGEKPQVTQKSTVVKINSTQMGSIIGGSEPNCGMEGIGVCVGSMFPFCRDVAGCTAIGAPCPSTFGDVMDKWSYRKAMITPCENWEIDTFESVPCHKRYTCTECFELGAMLLCGTDFDDWQYSGYVTETIPTSVPCGGGT